MTSDELVRRLDAITLTVGLLRSVVEADYSLLGSIRTHPQLPWLLRYFEDELKCWDSVSDGEPDAVATATLLRLILALLRDEAL